MGVTSIAFLVFVGISLLFYYVFPIRYRWIVLLVDSIIFFFANATGYTVIYLMFSISSIYFATMYFLLDKDSRRKKMVLIAILLSNIAILAVLKYTNLGISLVNYISEHIDIIPHIEAVTWAAPLAISFYTLQMVSYLLDCYWGMVKPEKNPLKVALYCMFFPQMVSGPISRFDDLGSQLFVGNKFAYENLTYGSQRVLWGFFKKLVISARLSILISTIYADPSEYFGVYIWVATLLFPLQLYTDFSGCMDIIIGVSEMFGIKMTENFNLPFFSTNTQEFWRRWHITLGTWLRDYIMNPILKSKWMQLYGKFCKKHFGKKAGKRLMTYLAMLFLWCSMGLWHGNSVKYIVGEGLWFWFVIVAGQLMEPIFEKAKQILKVDDSCFSWKLFQMIRTYCIVAFGLLFFNASSFRMSIKIINLAFYKKNIWVLFDQSLYTLGLETRDFWIGIWAIVFMWIVEVKMKEIPIREEIAKQNLVFRWLVWLVLFYIVLIFGKYGSGVDASAFIYQGF